MTETQTEFVTLAEAAVLLGVHNTTVRGMIRDGKLKAEKPSLGRRWRIRRDSLVLPGEPPAPPSPLDLAIDRYEAVRSGALTARTGTPERVVAAARWFVAENALMALLKEHGRQYRRNGIFYTSDGSELFRYRDPGSAK